MKRPLPFACISILLLACFFGNRSFSQNVGIGTATPLEKLHIIGNIRSSTLAGAGSRIVLSDLNGTLINATGANSPAWMTLGNSGLINGTHFLGTTDNIDLRFRTNNLERITIKNTGAIGLFTNAPATTWLHSIPPTLANDFQFKWDNNLNGDAPARFQSTQVTNGNRVFLGVTNYNSTAFAATAVMGLALNNTVTSGLAGAEGVRGFNNSTSGIGVYAGFTGGNQPSAIGWALFANGWAGGITPWLNVSDERFKTNISVIEGALGKILQIRGVEYNFNSQQFPKMNFSDTRQIGFIAQEIEAVFPSMVQTKGVAVDGGEEISNGFSAPRESYNMKAVAYTDLIPVLVEAIKEQQKMIDELRKEIDILKSGK
jgi:hypothetical protein